MLKISAGTLSPLYVPKGDIEHCYQTMGIETWLQLAGQRIFITGGTGFVGKWLLATLIEANATLGLACKITVLSRNPAEFLCKWPEIKECVNWVLGDVRSFSMSKERFDVVIHAATDVVRHASPEEIFSTCVEGTRSVLELSYRCQASKLLLVSSGAVYGALPSGMTHVSETYLDDIDSLQLGSAYSEGKRQSELLVARANINQLEVKIARIFALVGPHLPLDKHFAIGNFIGAAMTNAKIVIRGDGTPYRSYLYAADMSAWLWSILLKGKPGEAYNVGAEESISIIQLARRVCQVLDSKSRIEVLGHSIQGAIQDFYVPNCKKAMRDFGLPKPLTLDESILRTAEWGYSLLGRNA